MLMRSHYFVPGLAIRGSFSKNAGTARNAVRSAAPALRIGRSRRSTVSVEARKVALLGAGGGIGQPLALLLKMNKLVTELALYDIANVEGVAADISHCNTPVKVAAYTGPDQLAACLKGAELVVIPAGVPRKPGMTRDDLFNVNAGIVKALVEAVAKNSPSAIIEIVTNPVNSTVPIAAETLKKAGCYDPRKVLGVTTLDVVRANTFVSEAKGLDMKDVDVPVIGGHAGITILPLLSQATPPVTFSEAEKKVMTEKIQNAGTVVVEAKAGKCCAVRAGKGSATLSMAYAAARMAESTLLGLNGEPNIYECAFVQSEVGQGARVTGADVTGAGVVPDTPFFATKVLLGPQGVSQVLGLGSLDAWEQQQFEAMLPELKAQIVKGQDFVLKPPAGPAPA
ncbi:hypothetical protein QJQ45_021644 [Haematococcus lacustris]|nr:hypothetical protein QJQ45_021644 [Haematococcus lacustris]